MFKKICNFIIMITCGINILSLFIYPIYEIKDIEILKSGVFVETLEECGFFKKNNKFSPKIFNQTKFFIS